MKRIVSLLLLLLYITFHGFAENGHQLWLRNKSAKTVDVVCSQSSATLTLAKQELQQGWLGESNASIALTLKSDKAIKGDGFRLRKNEVQANTESGILYGVYELLRCQQTGQSVNEKVSNPSYERRILNHWDNQDGTVERGYAGLSIFWRKGDEAFAVTEADKRLWTDYARANASVGINGAVLNNVNASPTC